MKPFLFPIVLFCVVMGSFYSCGNKSDESLELHILKPGQGEVWQLEDPVAFELSVVSSINIEKIQIILEEQHSTPDTIFNETLGQSGNFTVNHTHHFDTPGPVIAIFNIIDGAGIVRISDQVSFTLE